MRTSEQVGELFAALAAAQAAIKGAKRDASNPAFNSKYADLEAVLEAARAPLAANGLAVIQTPEHSDDALVHVTTRIGHKSGQWAEATMSIPVGKINAHGYGSAITYCRRYMVKSFLNMADRDDDGNEAAENSPRPHVEQRKPDTATQVTHDAYEAMPSDAQVIVREWAMEVLGIMEDASIPLAQRIDKAARFVLEKTHDGSDQDGLLALSSQLDSKVRNPIKLRMQEIHRERKAVLQGKAVPMTVVIAPGTKPVAALASQA